MIGNLKNEGLFQSMFQLTAEGVLVVNKTGAILMANPACKNLFGYNPDSLLSKSIEILITEKYRKQLKKHIINPEKITVNKNLDVIGIKKNGTEFSLEIRLTPTVIDDKNLIITFLRDTSNRTENLLEIKKANNKLIESNHKFNTLINNVKGILFRSENNKDYTMHYISEGCLEITGYTFQDFQNKIINYGQLIIEADRNKVWEHIQTAIKQKKPYDFEYRIQHKNGCIKYVLGKGKAVYNNQNKAIALEGFITDITAQKETETQLRHNEAKTKALLEAMPDMMFIQDREGIYLDCYANKPEELFFLPENFIGVNMKAVLDASIYKIIKASHKKVIASGTMQVAEYYVQRKNETNYYEARVVLMNNHKLLTIVRNITENKKLEQDINKVETRSNAILNAVPDLFFVHDENVNILELYASNPTLLNAPKEALLGKNTKDILPSKIANQIADKLTKVRKTKQMETLQLNMKSLNGLVDFDVRIVPLEDNKTLSIARDVTEKKAQEKELLIKDRALASASNSIIIVDLIQPNTPIIFCNEAFEKMTGYTKGDVLGKDYKILKCHKEDQKEIDIMTNAILKGETCHVVLRTYRKDGTMFWSNIDITSIYNKNNTLTHFIAVQSDVTKKVAKEQLKNQTQKILELIAKDTPIKTIAEKIIETAETHLKNSIGSVLLLEKEDKTLHILAAPNLPKAFRDYIEGTVISPRAGSCGTAAFFKKEVIVSNIATNVLWEDHKGMATKHGLKACWAFPIMSSTNQVLGTFSVYNTFARTPLDSEKEILLDITYLASVAIENYNKTMQLQESKKQLELYAQKLEDKVQERTHEVMATVKELVAANLNLEDQILITKEAESEAVTSKNMASEIAKNFPNGFVVVVNKDLVVQFAEGEALSQLGLKPFITNGTIIDDISVFSEERKEQIKEDFKNTLIGQYLSSEVYYKNRYFAANTAPLFDENNQIIYALHVFSDITHQKEIELNIQNALKKEKDLNELKSRFVSMASHEFRTPLSAILTSSILIGKQNEPGKELKREKYVAQIEKNVNHLVNILNDFLSLSKLEEGKIVTIKERFDLVHFSKDLVEESELNLKKPKRTNLNTTEEELYVYLDAKLLRHIIINLLSNAYKYSKENTPIDFKISKNQDNVVIQITDQGIGIPEEEQKHLYDRFFRAKNAANIEGTGLGLNIVKSYTELMGGTIEVQSGKNKGTTFWVELPIESL